MKRLIISLLLVLSFVPFIWGQRPTVVDNSAWFGPAVTQFGNGCQVFSLAYLKSYIWNKQFQRNPALPENQFSGYSLWNQSINTFQHYAIAEGAFYMMINQGAVTTDRFSMPSDVETLPSLEARESGLQYRSAKLTSIDVLNTAGGAPVFLNQLKDSLNSGKCFILSFPIFNYINQLYNKTNAIYVCPEGISKDSILASHASVVVGYDDNILTANGRKGAFKLLNSWGPNFGDQGFFYLDYNWFVSASWWNYSCYFLEEDFGHKPELTLNIQVSNTVSGEDIDYRRAIFADTIYTVSGNRFDYNFNDYFYYPHLLKIKKVNNQTIASPSIILGNIINKTPDVVFLPSHNHDGNRQVLADLTDYIKASDFKSLELIVNDPISAIYIDGNGNTVYSYTREAKAQINEAYIKILSSNKCIVGRVTNLPDTTIVSRDFYSEPARYHITPYVDRVFISKCTSILKRQLITFRIEDINSLPFFTSVPPDTLRATIGKTVAFQFQAQDADGDQLNYSLATPASGASINSSTGLFQFQSAQPVKKQFEVVVTDGKGNVVSRFNVEIDNAVGIEDNNNLPKEYKLVQNYPNPFNPSTVINFSLPKSGFVSLKVYNALGQEVATLVNGELGAGVHNTKFDAASLNLASGIYIYRLQSRDFAQAKKMVLTK